jgi:hypothetical protein
MKTENISTSSVDLGGCTTLQHRQLGHTRERWLLPGISRCNIQTCHRHYHSWQQAPHSSPQNGDERWPCPGIRTVLPQPISICNCSAFLNPCMISSPSFTNPPCMTSPPPSHTSSPPLALLFPEHRLGRRILLSHHCTSASRTNSPPSHSPLRKSFLH